MKKKHPSCQTPALLVSPFLCTELGCLCLWFISNDWETAHPTCSDRRGSWYSSGPTRTTIIFSFLMILRTRNVRSSWKWLDTDPPSTQTVNYHFCEQRVRFWFGAWIKPGASYLHAQVTSLLAFFRVTFGQESLVLMTQRVPKSSLPLLRRVWRETRKERELLMSVKKKKKKNKKLAHIFSQKTQVTEVGTVTIRSAAASVEAALRVLWPPCRRWQLGGGALSRCSLIVPADCAPLDADGAVSSTTALRWLNPQPVKPLLITYILLDGPRRARLNAPDPWSRRQRFRAGQRGVILYPHMQNVC